MSYVCVDCGGKIEVKTSTAFADGPRHDKGGCDYDPYERHGMPVGTEVFTRASDHTYHTSITRKKGKWVGQGRWGDLGSTSHISKFADPSADNLMDWAARKQVDGVYQLGELEDGFTYDSGSELLDLLKKHKLTWRDLRDQAGDTGTNAHNYFEDRLSGQPKGGAGGHYGAVDAFLDDHAGLTPLQTEAVVYSAEHGFAGRFDARVKINGETCLIDLKTSKYIGRSYHAQIHGYDLAAEECGYGASDRLLILQTREDGTYTLWPARSDRETFLHCLALYRKGKETDAATRADFKELGP